MKLYLSRSLRFTIYPVLLGTVGLCNLADLTGEEILCYNAPD